MAYATDTATPVVTIEPDADTPVRQINSAEMRDLGQRLSKTFKEFAQDRQVAEQQWLKNLRQYLGIYDPEIERLLAVGRSRAYPRITRVKCISVVSRLMNLMFPGNEKNWELGASPSADMSPEDVMEAIKQAAERMQEAGVEDMPADEKFINQAVQHLAEDRARELETLIDDQLQEIGGDQTCDYIALNRRVVMSGVLYGLGVLRGPFVREETRVNWVMNDVTQQPEAQKTVVYKPQFEFLPVWDFYPDMSARDLSPSSMDGYFIRLVMTKAQLRKLAKREDFFGDVIKKYLSENTSGNYKPQTFETELRSMGLRENVTEQNSDRRKYEIVIWNGPISADKLKAAGIEVAENQMSDDIDAEIWICGDKVIKADINPWRKLGVDVHTIHTFLFDEDDTSAVGAGMPQVMRDSQMSICAATRMLLDNASVTCGPQLEVNLDLVDMDQDIKQIEPYKIWYREGTGPEAAYPAVRNVNIDAHLDELLKVIEIFMRFADMETFVGPATGGDMEQRGMGEPMRTAAGASMLRGDAALPFKDIVRNFDSFTQSLILSLVQFNKKFNPGGAKEGDFNVIARGATSLIAKEVRGMQVDQMAQSLTPDERLHVNDRKFVEARFAVRDMSNLLDSEDDVKLKRQKMQEQEQEQMQKQDEQQAAQVRKTLAEAFKNITQGQKNVAAADAAAVNSALELLTKGLENIDQVEGVADGTGQQAGKATPRKAPARAAS